MLIGYLKQKYFNLKKNRILKSISNKGKHIQIHSDLRVVYPNRLTLGSFIYLGLNCRLCAQGKIKIGSGTIIGENFTIHSVNHNYKSEEMIPFDTKQFFRPVEIGENVWIGDNVIVLPGTKIGEGVIVGAGAVVSGSIPECAIIVGNPCRILKYRDTQKYFELKEENKIYLKLKFENSLEPDYNN